MPSLVIDYETFSTCASVVPVGIKIKVECVFNRHGISDEELLQNWNYRHSKILLERLGSGSALKDELHVAIFVVAVFSLLRGEL